MMTYAAYLMWLTKKAVDASFPPHSWEVIYPLIERELEQQEWYRQPIIQRISASMSENSPDGTRTGRYLGASAGPWFDAVMATTLAGFKLDHSVDMAFTLYVMYMSGEVLKSVPRMSPSAR